MTMIKKFNFKAVVCICLALITVLSLASCGTRQPIDKYEKAAEEVCASEGMSYDTKSIDYRNKKENEIKETYGFDAEIDRMFIIRNESGEEQACIVKFYKEAQAKKFERKYKAEKAVNLFAKIDRVLSFVKGEYEGEILDIFKFDYACERDGDIVVYGNSEFVSAVTKAK